MNRRDVIIFSICLIICFLPGIIGSIYVPKSIQDWYINLKKPFLNPPNWVFAFMWIILYLLMAFSLYFLIKKAGKLSYIKWALLLFILQLFLNGLWAFVFFGLKSIFSSIFIIIILWFIILICLREFKVISTEAYYFMIPYFIWLSFALYLNIAIYLINK